MKRHYGSLLAILVLVAGAIAIHSKIKGNERRKREAAYDAIIMKYSSDLKPGLSRKEIKDYLQTKGARIFDWCCRQQSWSTLTKIGDKDPPWVCSAAIVYAVFEFPPRGFGVYLSESDVLEKCDGRRS